MVRFEVRWRSVFVCAAGLLLLISLRDSDRATPGAQYNKAQLLFVKGQLEKCQRLAEQGYIQNRTGNPEWAAEFQLLDAEVLLRRGMYDDALNLLRAFHSPTQNQEDVIRKLVIESVALARQQQLSSADQRINEAEYLCKNKTSAACGEMMQARGTLAVSADKLREARFAFLGALAIARSLHDRYLESTTTLDLGWLALQAEHFDESVDWSRDAYQISTELGAEDLAESISGNLGWAYFGLGDAERALELFIEAEQRAANLGNSRNEIKWLTASGDVYWRTGDFARARDSYSSALTRAKQIKNKEEVINTLEDLTHASIDAGNLDEASGYAQQLGPLLSANNNRLDTLDVTFAQARIAAATHQNNDAEHLLRAVENDPVSQTSMKLGAQHELARLYESEGNLVAADRMYRTSLSTFESARDQLHDEESKLPFLANATGIYDDYIHFLVAQRKTDAALALADQSRARTLQQGLGLKSNATFDSEVSVNANAIARKANATLLFYWVGEKESYLWTITPAKTTMIPLPARSKLAPMVDRYRKSLLGLSDPIERQNADGIGLYHLLIEPVRDFIQPGSNTVILDDGFLSQLDFETLIAPAPTPHYFIEDATLFSAPSLRLLASAKQSESRGNTLLLLGDAVSPNSDYPELPKAAAEMKQIEQQFPGQEETVFARERATAGSYASSNPQQFTYIHFVAHGVASRTDPLDSAIILSRSSADDDSFKLHAREIIQHPIHARLVTVSACYGSGTRAYAGEGLVGLAWAFLRAGAHNVIGGLWEVSDESTPRLMGSLYQGLHNGMPPATALRQAKLSLLHAKGEFRKPFFWASLQIYTGL
ncbi:CHAT domain-containing protein [Telmatobacter sp. DSM 110680]|uniref:CHAT domain-containing protein n=1 Tax=Telmatobacter sp. DSM 110680 TaxID=3036704 RepID=A0AAU7DPI4_9BACT